MLENSKSKGGFAEKLKGGYVFHLLLFIYFKSKDHFKIENSRNEILNKEALITSIWQYVWSIIKTYWNWIFIFFTLKGKCGCSWAMIITKWHLDKSVPIWKKIMNPTLIHFDWLVVWLVGFYQPL